jgi:superfamily II DNA or RNA helicase
MNLEVKPTKWVLPNRIGYNKYVYHTFNQSKYPTKAQKQSCECLKDQCDINSDTLTLFPQQRIVRDFIQVNSPYRGILLYHELGSGKSAASIAAAEGYVEKKKVFILTPSSLAQNYENELMKISKIGLDMKKSWSQIQILPSKLNELYEKYAISKEVVKKDGMVWVPLYKDDIDDVVKIQSNKTFSSLTSKEKLIIEGIITNIIRNRYTFVSYNGLTQNLVRDLKNFDDSFVIIDEVHNFISRVVNGSKLARSVYNSLMSASNCKLVLLSGTPVINNPYEIATLINLIRGPMQISELSLLKKSFIPTTEQLIVQLKQSNMYKYIDDIYFNKTKNNIFLSLLPPGYERSNNDVSQIVFEPWNYTTKDLIKQIVQSINKIDNIKVSSVVSNSSFYALPNNSEEFNNMFINTSDEENITLKNEDLFKRRILGTLSYYKTTGTDLFPDILPTKFQYLNMTNHQINIYAGVRNKERAMDNNRKINKFNGSALSDKSSVYRAFSRMVCNFAFPEDIPRVFPQDIRAMMKKEMQVENDEEDEEKTNASTKQVLRKAREEYDKSLENALIKLKSSDYLDRKNLKEMYSPKYAKMLEDVEESPGTVLIYSQFRTIEGLGIFSHVLEREGYREIIIKKTDKGYVFDDIGILDKKYDNKRYVVFNNDRAKTNILMNLFNGSFSLLQDSILDQLKDRDQLRGKLVKIMMITQSGAEGISLKNVRRVLIMEYFWNSVRINQVIGRAARTCSHEMLPKSERNVQVFSYIMKFSKKQLENDFTLRRLDKEITTDEHILQLAQKKDFIINEFLKMLRASSFDCIINSTQNKPMKNGYKCYNWAINADVDDFSFTKNIDDERKIQKHQKYQVLQKATGKVAINKNNGKKYVMVNNKLYDYFSYKNTGLLIAPLK